MPKSFTQNTLQTSQGTERFDLLMAEILPLAICQQGLPMAEFERAIRQVYGIPSNAFISRELRDHVMASLPSEAFIRPHWMEAEEAVKGFTAKIASTAKAIYIKGLLIDSRTGEVLGYDDRPSILTGQAELRPELSKCRSVDDLHEFLEHVDLRSLPPFSKFDLIDAQDHAHGQWKRTGVDCRITLPMMNTLCTLHGLVKYANIIMMTKAGLAKALGVAESNLTKKLAPLVSAKLLRVYTSRDGIRKGEIKLLVNPRLIFRGYDNVREAYVKEWYLEEARDSCPLTGHISIATAA
ncbi:hypothetical protein [Pseudomonas corrugata]|uniref:hypothetical protein n=1 Tax=Pseudomonas corrugata TaxID=47879 RepID=UPI002234A2B6|nr:hypothetical protein [Pseudomonas corrugata]UZE04703.1 hypothetical protein LOY65_18685 [Pseudomonas corrugata]